MTPEEIARLQEQARAQRESLNKFVENMTSPKMKRAATILFLLTVVGILIGTMAPSPVSLTDTDHSKYQSALVAAEHNPEYYEALDALNHEQANVDEAKVWFWRFRPAHRKRVNEREIPKAKALARFQAKQNERNALISKAKASVGIWSKYGIEETREQFWQTFQEGKDMGKRMTFYDMFFSMFQSRSRDENAASVIIGWMIRILMNYTIGMLFAVVRFMFQLGSIVWSYSPNFLSGSLFFAVAAFSACSLIGAFLLLMYASCVGCCLFMSNANGERSRRGNTPPEQQRLHQNNNHYD
jgi:hypothetical protein